MPVEDSKAITGLLGRIRKGEHDAEKRLIEIVYPELRKLAQHYMQYERPDHTLQATALVHEVYLRLFGAEPLEWQDRAHFFAIVAQQMRKTLVDHARAVRAKKRGGEWVKLSLDEASGVPERRDEDLIAVDEALERLEKLDSRAGRVVELRFFAGLKESEAAEVLGISLATLKRDWEFARAWLFNELRAR